MIHIPTFIESSQIADNLPTNISRTPMISDVIENITQSPAIISKQLQVEDILEWTILHEREEKYDINSCIWGAQQQQQRSDEDRYQAKRIGPYRYFAVFDGHAGTKKMDHNHTADYCVEHLHKRLASSLGRIDLNNTARVSETIIQVFIAFDREMYDGKKLYGCTCSAVLIDDERGLIYHINLGDSRSILFNDSEIIFATDDHKPENYTEKTRIYEAGGFIWEGRVNGMLMLSRAFGNFGYGLKLNREQYDPINGRISAVPDINITEISRKVKQDEIPMYIILTSDAPYENCVFNDNSLVELFREYNKQINVAVNPRFIKLLAIAMVNQIAPKTTDDVTIILVQV
jgi:serine/threonine protein phosphatase PrpC